jgi:hypothetical protein
VWISDDQAGTKLMREAGNIARLLGHTLHPWARVADVDWWRTTCATCRGAVEVRPRTFTGMTSKGEPLVMRCDPYGSCKREITAL